MSSPSISALTAGSSFSATIAALTKIDIKPSRTPCFFSNVSRQRSRNAIAPDMSISLNVVSIAAFCCASFRRSAMRRRSRVMRTRVSRPVAGRGRGGAVTGGGAGSRASRDGGADLGSAGGSLPGEGAECASAATTSCFVMRPPRPVGVICAASSAVSAISLRAAGPDRSSASALRFSLPPLAGRGRGGGRLGAPGKARPFGGDVEPRQHALDAAVDKAPGAHILGLLLAPHDVRARIAPQHIGQGLERERIELLDPDQRHRFVTLLG